MNRTSTGVMDPRRRRQLLMTAAHEFARAGFEHASLNSIIQACGMSKSSFYYYFTSKVALFDIVIDEAACALASDLRVPAPESLGTDFWKQIEDIFLRLLELSARQPWYIDLGKLFYLADVPVEGSQALKRCLARFAAWLDAALAAGRTSGAVRDDIPATLQAELVLAVLQAMDRWSLHHSEDFVDDERQLLVTKQLAALRRLLAPESVTAPR